jgi:hypothetical protein
MRKVMTLGVLALSLTLPALSAAQMPAEYYFCNMIGYMAKWSVDNRDVGKMKQQTSVIAIHMSLTDLRMLPPLYRLRLQEEVPGVVAWVYSRPRLSRTQAHTDLKAECEQRFRPDGTPREETPAPRQAPPTEPPPAPAYRIRHSTQEAWTACKARIAKTQRRGHQGADGGGLRHDILQQCGYPVTKQQGGYALAPDVCVGLYEHTLPACQDDAQCAGTFGLPGAVSSLLVMAAPQVFDAARFNALCQEVCQTKHQPTRADFAAQFCGTK